LPFDAPQEGSAMHQTASEFTLKNLFFHRQNLIFTR
jgi:hypothetical protein